jgi:hypothetical protein
MAIGLVVPFVQEKKVALTPKAKIITDRTGANEVVIHIKLRKA